MSFFVVCIAGLVREGSDFYMAEMTGSKQELATLGWVYDSAEKALARCKGWAKSSNARCSKFFE